MSKLSTKLRNNKFVITAELFPPKGTNTEELLKKADIIGPVVDAINVTDNQRASMRLASMAVSKLILDKGFEPVMQITCRDRNRIALQSDLLGAYALGIRNVLILSGDHPKIGENKEAKGVYDLDTVQLLKTAKVLSQGHDLAEKKLNGSPEFCVGAVVNPTAVPDDLQVMMMGKKISAGAEFFQTQPIFDIESYKIFHEKVKHYKTKILPGVILLKSLKFVNFMNSLPGVNIPLETIKRIENSKDPLKEGIDICSKTIYELKKFADGVHVMAIGMEQYIPEILENS